MYKISLILFFLLICFPDTSFAACHNHEVKANIYTQHLEDLEDRFCYFPKTGKRAPCLDTELGQEIRIKQLASLTLADACHSYKPSKSR